MWEDGTVALYSNALLDTRCNIAINFKKILGFVASILNLRASQLIQQKVRVRIDGHGYEPDFAFVDKTHGVYIDIEIDEPYTARGIASHYVNDGVAKDGQRNERFLAAGWHVVRFSERQMFCETEACMKLICELALQLGASFPLPDALRDVGTVTPDECWSAADAKRYFQQHYRESYLGMPIASFNLNHLGRYLELGLPILQQAITNKQIPPTTGATR